MPRRSAAAVDFMPLTAEHDRPPPPEGMPEPQAAIWRKTVASMRATWFTPECHDLLSRYCGAMAEAARLEAELPCVNVGDPLRGRLLSQYDLMAKLALPYGRALRLTPKANRVSTADGAIRDAATTLSLGSYDAPSRSKARHGRRLITRLAQTAPLDLLEMSKRASVLKRVKKNRWLSITSHTQHA